MSVPVFKMNDDMAATNCWYLLHFNTYTYDLHTNIMSPNFTVHTRIQNFMHKKISLIPFSTVMIDEVPGLL